METTILYNVDILVLKFKCGIVKLDRNLLKKRFKYPGFECKENELDFTNIVPVVNKKRLKNFINHLYRPNFHRVSIKSRKLAELLLYFDPKFTIYVHSKDSDLVNFGAQIGYDPEKIIGKLIVNMFSEGAPFISILHKQLKFFPTEMLLKQLHILDFQTKKYILKTRRIVSLFNINRIIMEMTINDAIEIVKNITEEIQKSDEDNSLFLIKRRKEINSVIDSLIEKGHWKK